MSEVTINLNLPDGRLCPKCLGSGKVKAMQAARYINGPTIRVEDTRVPCDMCGGCGMLRGGAANGKETKTPGRP